jgi:hypothetical protein
MGNLSSAFEKADTSDVYPYVTMNFIAALEICFRQLYEVAQILFRALTGWGKGRFF